MDVFYDHFLSNTFNRYSDESLPEFIDWVNRCFVKNGESLPLWLKEPTRSMHWLASYKEEEGVGKALARLSARSKRGADLTPSLTELQTHHEGLTEDFLEFFPDVIRFVAQRESEGKRRIE